MATKHLYRATRHVVLGGAHVYADTDENRKLGLRTRIELTEADVAGIPELVRVGAAADASEDKQIKRTATK